MKLDAAWHVWFGIALAVVIVGMLAVSAQCGCCHHWLLSCYALSCLVPFNLAFCFLLLITLHGFCLYLCFFLFFTLTWCICYRVCGLYFGGGSYSSVYVPPPLFVFPIVLIVYIPSFFLLLCFVYLFLFSHMPLCFSFAHLCVFYPCLDENFWGVYAYAFYHMQLYVEFGVCILNISCYV